MKKLLISFFAIVLFICGGSTVVAEEPELLSAEEFEVCDEISVRTEEYIENNQTYKLIYVFKETEEGLLKIVYNNSTGEVRNCDTNELVAMISEPVRVNEFSAISESGTRSYTYRGYTIADRWVYSYTDNMLISTYNASVDLIVAAMIGGIVGQSVVAVATSVLETIALQVLNKSIHIHGNANQVDHYISFRRYANIYVLSDFANFCEELDEELNYVGVIAVSPRLSQNNG